MNDDYYAILGVAKRATSAEIKQAYLRLARDNHPDRFTDPQERADADTRFQQITEAFNQLRDERLRQEYDRSLQKETKPPKEEARLFFKNAELREQSRDYESALKYYYEAMRLQPQNLDYILGAARILTMDKSKQRQAADLLNQAMQIDPTAPEPHLELGALYQKSGMIVRARRVYESALKQLPDDIELKQRLDNLKDK